MLGKVSNDCINFDIWTHWNVETEQELSFTVNAFFFIFRYFTDNNVKCNVHNF